MNITSSSCDDFDQGVVRRTIASMYSLKKVLSTLDNIRIELKQSIGYTGNKGRLRKDLLHKKFTYTLWGESKIADGETRCRPQQDQIPSQGQGVERDRLHRHFSDETNLPPKCVLVMDNATYHNVQVDRRPVRTMIQECLTKHVILWSAGMLEDELLEVCKTHPQEPVFVSRLPLNKDKITHPGSHAVYNSKALARLQGIEVNYWASDIVRDEMPKHVVTKSGFR